MFLLLAGAGRGGLGKILLGAALIAGAFMFTPLTFANFSTTTGIGFTSAGIGKAFVYLGASLVLQGVSDMLFPVA